MKLISATEIHFYCLFVILFLLIIILFLLHLFRIKAKKNIYNESYSYLKYKYQAATKLFHKTPTIIMKYIFPLFTFFPLIYIIYNWHNGQKILQGLNVIGTLLVPMVAFRALQTWKEKEVWEIEYKLALEIDEYLTLLNNFIDDFSQELAFNSVLAKMSTEKAGKQFLTNNKKQFEDRFLQTFEDKMTGIPKIISKLRMLKRCLDINHKVSFSDTDIENIRICMTQLRALLGYNLNVIEAFQAGHKAFPEAKETLMIRFPHIKDNTIYKKFYSSYQTVTQSINQNIKNYHKIIS